MLTKSTPLVEDEPKKFPSISQFRHVIEAVEYATRFTGEKIGGNPVLDDTIPLPTLDIRGTVKLHGTNAGVSLNLETDALTTLSRTRPITPEDDNYGFSRFVFEHEAEIRELFDPFHGSPGVITIFGEWCGKGIMKKTAINELEKMWMIFAIHHDPVPENDEPGMWLDLFAHRYVENPDIRVFNVENFPIFTDSVDFTNPSSALERLSEFTLQVEEQCPVGAAFGVEGIGEGIVWTIQDPEYLGSRFWFKTKGKKHKVSKTKTVVEIDPEVVASIEEFVDATVTEQRLEQGIEALIADGVAVTDKATGTYLRWIFHDIIKEESDRLEASDLEESDVSKEIMHKARNWWFDYLNKKAGL